MTRLHSTMALLDSAWFYHGYTAVYHVSIKPLLYYTMALHYLYTCLRNTVPVFYLNLLHSTIQDGLAVDTRSPSFLPIMQPEIEPHSMNAQSRPDPNKCSPQGGLFFWRSRQRIIEWTIVYFFTFILVWHMDLKGSPLEQHIFHKRKLAAILLMNIC